MNKRRMNVALTRARDGLVIIGCAETPSAPQKDAQGEFDDPDAWSSWLQGSSARGLVADWDA